MMRPSYEYRRLRLAGARRFAQARDVPAGIPGRRRTHSLPHASTRTATSLWHICSLATMQPPPTTCAAGRSRAEEDVIDEIDEALNGLAVVGGATRGLKKRAARLAGAASAFVPPTLTLDERDIEMMIDDRYLAPARRRLGEAHWDLIARQGARLDRAAALELASSACAETTQRAKPAAPDGYVGRGVPGPSCVAERCAAVLGSAVAPRSARALSLQVTGRRAGSVPATWYRPRGRGDVRCARQARAPLSGCCLVAVPAQVSGAQHSRAAIADRRDADTRGRSRGWPPSEALRLGPARSLNAGQLSAGRHGDPLLDGFVPIAEPGRSGSSRCTSSNPGSIRRQLPRLSH